mmetsp:Transcript_83153/g.258155  ORF Transcript_83153/g.258155 Transcript_83153/m.258155 type:complete len:233 (-) Transcript_83153:56-754(-)
MRCLRPPSPTSTWTRRRATRRRTRSRRFKMTTMRRWQNSKIQLPRFCSQRCAQSARCAMRCCRKALCHLPRRSQTVTFQIGYRRTASASAREDFVKARQREQEDIEKWRVALKGDEKLKQASAASAPVAAGSSEGAPAAAKRRKNMKQATSLSITKAKQYLLESPGCTVLHDTSEDRIRAFYNQGRASMSCQISVYGTEVAIKKCLKWCWGVHQRVTGAENPYHEVLKFESI